MRGRGASPFRVSPPTRTLSAAPYDLSQQYVRVPLRMMLVARYTVTSAQLALGGVSLLTLMRHGGRGKVFPPLAVMRVACLFVRSGPQLITSFRCMSAYMYNNIPTTNTRALVRQVITDALIIHHSSRCSILQLSKRPDVHSNTAHSCQIKPGG